MQGDPKAPQDQQRKEHQDQRRADKAKFLANYGKNKVVVLLGQIQKLLPAPAKPQAAEAAGADGIQGLDDLIPLIRGAGKGIAPGVDAGGCVGKKGQQHRKARARAAQGRAEPAQANPAQKHHHAAYGDDDDRRGKMRLQHQQAHDQAQDPEKGQDPPADGPHLLPEAADQHREGQDHRQLCQLRGLDRQAPHTQPAAGAVGLYPDHRHQGQQHQRRPQKRDRPAPVQVHGHPGGQQKDRQPQKGVNELSDKVIGSVAPGHLSRVIIGPGKAGGEHHDYTDGQQQHHQQEKAAVKAPPPGLRFRINRAGKAGAVVTHASTSRLKKLYRAR